MSFDHQLGVAKGSDVHVPLHGAVLMQNQGVSRSLGIGCSRAGWSLSVHPLVCTLWCPLLVPSLSLQLWMIHCM